jgi:hypothetical protein
LWNQKTLFDLWELWNEKIREINPQASYIANAGGGALSPLDMKTIGELAPALFCGSPGKKRPHGPMGQRKEWKGISGDNGKKGHRGDL